LKNRAYGRVPPPPLRLPYEPPRLANRARFAAPDVTRDPTRRREGHKHLVLDGENPQDLQDWRSATCGIKKATENGILRPVTVKSARR